ncbi:MAG: hypothetical protein FWH48_01910 [Oscillospiraceae bacterium]|nr:hypothetical protein [Oscillospiraceae bacterium]
MLDKKATLVEFITQDIIAKITKEKEVEIAQAMKDFYSSETFENLQDYETGLYLEGTDYIYDLFAEEGNLDWAGADAMSAHV